MKIKFWILVVIIYKVTGNVSCKFKSYRGSHLCCTKKLQQTKSTRYCVSCAFLLLYLVILSLDKIFEFNSCISALFSKNRS